MAPRHSRTSCTAPEVGTLGGMIRTLARPLLASWFVYGGVRGALEPQQRTATVEPVVGPLLRDAGVEVPVETLVRVHGNRDGRQAGQGHAGRAGALR